MTLIVPPKLCIPFVITPSKNPLFVNVELIIRVPPSDIRPELVTGAEIVTVWVRLIDLSSASPGTPGLFMPFRQVAIESQSPLWNEVKVSAYASSSVPTSPKIKIPIIIGIIFRRSKNPISEDHIVR